jgi:O-antigen/teichoic acid export membrane protein
LEKISSLLQKPFIRNVATIAGGTAIAQIITVLLSPVITRIYGPESFGILGVFLSVTGIVTVISTLTYAQAIVLPKKDTEAIAIVKISLFVAVGIAILLLIILVLFGNSIGVYLNTDGDAWLFYFVPVFLLFDACSRVFTQWQLRKKRFKAQAKATVAQVAVTQPVIAGTGFMFPTAYSLVILTTLGKAMLAALMARDAVKSTNFSEKFAIHPNNTENLRLARIARKYNDFPLFRSPQTLIFSLSQNLPILLLTNFFGVAAAGFYALGRKVLDMPSILFRQSVGNVFYPHIAQAANENRDIRQIVIKATVGLALVGIVPYGLVIYAGPWLFSVIFGNEWSVAGEYGRWISVMLFFGFISAPSIRTIPVLRLQHLFLIYEIAATILRISGLLVGFYVFRSDIHAIMFFCLVDSFLRILLTLYVVAKSGSGKRE